MRHRASWLMHAAIHCAGSILPLHFPARYVQTRLAPSPCFSLTTDPVPPSLPPPPLKCKTKYSPIRSAYVRCSRFTIRPSGKLRRFMAMLIIRSRCALQELRRLLSTSVRHRLVLLCRNRSKVSDREGAIASKVACAPQKQRRSDIAPAPLQLLPNHTEE